MTFQVLGPPVKLEGEVAIDGNGITLPTVTFSGSGTRLLICTGLEARINQSSISGVGTELQVSNSATWPGGSAAAVNVHQYDQSIIRRSQAAQFGEWTKIPTFHHGPVRANQTNAAVTIKAINKLGNPIGANAYEVRGLVVRELISTGLKGAIGLDVEGTYPSNTPYNLLPNPKGDQGGYGWVTPVANTAMRGYQAGASTRLLQFEYPGDSAPVVYFESEPVPFVVTNSSNSYSRLRWNISSIRWADDGSSLTALNRGRVEYLDSNKALVSSSPWTNGSTSVGGTAAAHYIGATEVRYARVRIEFPDNGVDVARRIQVNFKELILAKGPSAASLDPMPAATSNILWSPILPSTQTISIEREALDVGTINASLADATLDPAVAATLRPGRRLRVTALAPDLTTVEPLMLGQVSKPTTEYDLAALAANPGTSRYAKIALTAFDNVQRLAQTSRPDGYSTVAQLAAVLEGAGVPWVIDGNSNQVVASPITRNEDATALDQIAVTRDTRRAQAWVDRYNTFQAWSTAPSPNPIPVLTEDDYSDIRVGFDTDEMINEVSIVLMRRNLANGQTVEVNYGPYRDQTSIDTWGVASKTFRIQGLNDSPTAMQNFANNVLSSRATPTVRVRSITVPIRSTDDVRDGKALVDLYDLVRVTNAVKGINQTARVTSIEHRITAGSDPADDVWEMELSFTVDGGVAAPQVTPAVQSVPTITTENRGVFTGTTNGNGVVTFTHGLGAVPAYVQLTALRGPNHTPRWDQPNSSATNVNVHVVIADTGGNAANVSTSFVWEARL